MQAYTKAAYGVDRRTETARAVFARVRSVSASEFFGAGQDRLRGAVQATVLSAEYQGETEFRWGGVTYSIYRTYIGSGDYIELYGEVKSGMQGGNHGTV